jgi:hypothetical protein
MKAAGAFSTILPIHATSFLIESRCDSNYPHAMSIKHMLAAAILFWTAAFLIGMASRL